MKRISIWILATGISLCLAGFTASACSIKTKGIDNDTQQGRPEGKIHVLSFSDAAASAERAAAERFNKTSPIKVVVDSGHAVGVEYNAAVIESIKAGRSPDIFMSWGAAGIRSLARSGQLLPLDGFIRENPQLRDAFIPSVFREQVLDGDTYGIPMRGVSPVVLFHNKTVLRRLGLKPATTLSELHRQVSVLTSAGITPIGIGGADKWPQLMWFEYMFTRIMGSEVVAKGLNGSSQVWESNQSRAALQTIRKLVDSGAFGAAYDSVKYGDTGSAALLRDGKTAYELQGTWHYATTVSADASFANQIGWTPFPALGGGIGKPGEIAGNLSNFYNVSASTRYPETVRDYLEELYSDEFLIDQIELGNLPPTINAGELVRSTATLTPRNKEYLTFVVELVADAPTFQLSWDQTIPAERQASFQNSMAEYFNGSIDAQSWIRSMQQLTSDIP